MSTQDARPSIKPSQDFRIEFQDIPDDAILTSDEVALLLGGISRNSLNNLKYRDPNFPQPTAIRIQRSLTFVAADVRSYIRSMRRKGEKLQQQGKKKTGRPRSTKYPIAEV